MNRILIPMTTRMVESSASYQTYYRGLMMNQTFIHYLVSAVLVAAILVTLALVFRPMIRFLRNEENGTRLLLRMIPEKVRKDVPAIADFLDTGSITQNEKVQKINEVCQELSVVALLVIDWNGKVQHISKAAQEEFGYEQDEVLGKNIKMLMPDEIAQHHDEYLRNYRTTGVSKLLDRPRRLKAMRKDGTIFPIEILVREFKKSATESSFLGYVRNVQVEIDYERSIQVNEAVSDMSHIPVFVIDPKGTITGVNRAGLKTFAYPTLAELMGKNIKTVMPPRIAVNHDKYLDTYLRTRKKNVVDSSRKVPGLRKTGEEFQVEITVREVLNERGDIQCFIGYAKDLYAEMLFAQSVMANEGVISISPTPVVSISVQGTVLIFSAAAEQAWGYSSEEVVGNNIKMLMTDEDAVEHDGYLARYAKTGEKHVIDSTRKLTAKRKNGTSFLIEANIKELRKGDNASFIGYLKDLTQVYEAQYQSKLHKLIFATSPVPIIVIDEVGTVLAV